LNSSTAPRAPHLFGLVDVDAVGAQDPVGLHCRSLRACRWCRWPGAPGRSRSMKSTRGHRHAPVGQQLVARVGKETLEGVDAQLQLRSLVHIARAVDAHPPVAVARSSGTVYSSGRRGSRCRHGAARHCLRPGAHVGLAGDASPARTPATASAPRRNGLGQQGRIAQRGASQHWAPAPAASGAPRTAPPPAAPRHGAPAQAQALPHPARGRATEEGRWTQRHWMQVHRWQARMAARRAPEPPEPKGRVCRIRLSMSHPASSASPSPAGAPSAPWSGPTRPPRRL
jgi:hypothetical protein